MMRMDSIVLRCIAVCAGSALVAWSLGQGRIGGWGWLRAGQTLALFAGLVMLWRGALRKSPRSAYGRFPAGPFGDGGVCPGPGANARLEARIEFGQFQAKGHPGAGQIHWHLAFQQEAPVVQAWGGHLGQHFGRQHVFGLACRWKRPLG